MFLKKLFLKYKLSKFKKEKYFKYKFELFISNENESIIFEYKYFTKYLYEQVIQDIFQNGIEINKWFINGNQIESIKLLESNEVYILTENKYYDCLLDKDVNEIKHKYNKLLNLYNKK